MSVKYEVKDIVSRYVDGKMACSAIAGEIGLTRVRVWQILQAAGVDTSKRKYTVACSVCGKPLERTRARLRRARRPYCSAKCYQTHVASSTYQANRQGQRVARSVAAAAFDLKPENVVHHADGDCSNNNPGNLYVFATASDHHLYHRTDLEVPAYSVGRGKFTTLRNHRYNTIRGGRTWHGATADDRPSG